MLFSCMCCIKLDTTKNEIPRTTSAYESQTLLTIDMIDESTGLVINEEGSIVHTETGRAILITKIIQPSFSTFHTGSLFYLYNDKAIFSEYRERVRVHF